MIYLFDTSALAAHALHLPGAGQVQEVMSRDEAGLFASALSLFELAGVLKREGCEHLIPECWRVYSSGLEIVPVDAALAQAAWTIREQSGERLPIADAMIAATARALGATLVHRDRHLSSIPDTTVPQLLLSGT